jgi:site-specific DNA-cytosine methylase
MASHQRLNTCPTALSVFTGAGGLDLGIEAAGFKIVGCIESDPIARKTIRKNRPQWKLFPGDIEQNRRLSASDLRLRRRQLTILAGGPPCQPFSKAAQWTKSARGGLKDRRSRCIGLFFKLAESFLPKVILLENVPGFVDKRCDARKYVHRKLRTINRRCGTRYKLHARVINAAHYGIPQRRQRAILIAIRNGHTFDWPKPEYINRPISAWDALWNVKPARNPQCSGGWTDLLPSIPEGRNYLHHTNGNNGSSLFGYRTKFWSFLLKLNRSEPAWTIPANPGPNTGPFHWNNRPLAIEELARLQTFPKSWVFEGDTRAKVRQAGNATPPLLAEIIARQIRQQLFAFAYHERLRFRILRRHGRLRPLKVFPIPSKYRPLLKIHAAHPGPGKGPKPITSPKEQPDSQPQHKV